ncbi:MULTISPECIES: hypothetical protein [Providencia]|uniref:hypothetical protein n=1 Tax=Providencia TaxID=586 RepID=UPI00044AD9B5|nr:MULTISPECIES: hypothetical protein [Providencia]ETT07286.1 hypothetical protein HMPREF1562_3352 [Providencia alcalifaciens F90-2004]QNP20613.1 hypothetical protein H9L31_01595 [Providencia rettgeri]
MYDKIDFFSLEKEPSYKYGKLRNVIDEAQSILKAKKRTDQQLNNVLNLMYELMDEYIENEKSIEINRLKISIRNDIEQGKYNTDLDDLYPFQWVDIGKREFDLEFIGDDYDIDYCNFDNTDIIELLYKVLDKLKESDDFFSDAEPREYFAALSLHYAFPVTDRYDSFNSVSITSLDSTIIACNALSMGNILHETGKYIKINKGIADENKRLQEKNERNKKLLVKANDTKHKKNREAKELVCNDWVIRRKEFKNAIEAAKYYSPWLLKRGYGYSDTTIQRWILEHAKHVNTESS